MDEAMCAWMMGGFMNRCMNEKSYLISKGFIFKKLPYIKDFKEELTTE